jgi:hypothetical protein
VNADHNALDREFRLLRRAVRALPPRERHDTARILAVMFRHVRTQITVHQRIHNRPPDRRTHRRHP